MDTIFALLWFLLLWLRPGWLTCDRTPVHDGFDVVYTCWRPK